MFARKQTLLALLAVIFAFAAGTARAQDIQICFDAADKVTEGGTLAEADKHAAHAACQRALAETSSVVQKYQIQEADFDIVGRPPKASN